MKTIYYLSALALSTAFSTAKAQTDGESFLKNLEISGYADIFYKYDFDKNGNNTKTSFTVPNNSFEPDMFSLKLVHKSGKFSTTADLGFGSKEEVYNYAEDRSRFMIKQLFIDYNATENLKITGGSWMTHIGYEVLDSPYNDIYSMSYAFSYGPFYHTGLKGNYTWKKFNVMAGIADPTDLKSSFERIPVYDSEGNEIGKRSYNNKYFIWQLGYVADKLSIFLNGQVGSNNPLDTNISQFDVVASYQATEKLKFAANTTFVNTTYDDSSLKQNWSSYVGYIKYQVSDLLALNYRAEYLDNKDGVLQLGQTDGNTVFANTISATLAKGHFQLKPEFRFENSNKEIYADVHGNPKKNSGNFLVGAMYSF